MKVHEEETEMGGDSKLKFDKHDEKTTKKVRNNMNCFKLIRHHIPLKVVQLSMHAMIFSHLSYCVTVWSQASLTVVQPVASLYTLYTLKNPEDGTTVTY